VAIASTAIFLAAAPFAKRPLAPVPAFCRSIIGAGDQRSDHRGAAVRPVPHPALAVIARSGGRLPVLRRHGDFPLAQFPGLFAPAGVLGAGPQTTAWLYFFWHGGFPLFVAAYALLKDRPHQAGRARTGVVTPVLFGAALALAAAVALMLIATLGHNALPEIMLGDADASTNVFVASGTWLLILVALVALGRRRPHSVLDLWVMIVLCAWMFDVALASVLNHGRYDLGWYAGRI